MRILIAATLLLVLGMAGLVVYSETAKGEAPTSPTTSGSSEKFATISRGEVVDIRPHLAAGRWTVVEFTADW